MCSAFSRETKQWICLLNIRPDELIRDIYYNKYNDSLITASRNFKDGLRVIIYRSTKIECIRNGNPDAGLLLFESEMGSDRFVEVDIVNGKFLTYCDSTYKVFDLKNYIMLYSISEENLEGIKFGPGNMLLIYKITEGAVPLKILSIEDWTVLKSFNHILHTNKKVEFIIHFNGKILVKLEKENLCIVDVCNVETTTEVSETKFMTPSALTFLPEHQLILILRNNIFTVWNLRGEVVTSFEDLHLWHPDCETNDAYITSDGNLIFSYCVSGNVRSINISNILTGKCVATIKINESPPTAEEVNNSPPTTEEVNNSPPTTEECDYIERSCKRIKVVVQESMEDITAIFYNEDSNEIYTGNRNGFVHVWSN